MTHATAPRVLIVEDEPLIALSLGDLMVDSGFLVSGIAGRLAKALDMIKLDVCDVALLDANLAGVNSGPAGAALAALGVPYVVLSGYSSAQKDGMFPDAVLFMQKPFDPDRLIEELRKLIAQPAATEACR